jgi:hypothetical protein
MSKHKTRRGRKESRERASDGKDSGWVLGEQEKRKATCKLVVERGVERMNADRRGDCALIRFICCAKASGKTRRAPMSRDGSKTRERFFIT